MSSNTSTPRIAYVVLTCEKYIHTRVPWQLQTVFQHVPHEDIYYLAHTMDLENRLFSWGADDSYNGLPYKYTDFFRYAHVVGYDWIVLMDDDTYVFCDRLITMLSHYRTDMNFAMGNLLTHIAHTEWGAYFSGGAGTVLSRGAFELLCSYVQRTASVSELVPHWCADICIGRWLHRHPHIHQVHRPEFHPENVAATPQDLTTAITYHHLKTWEDYEYCYTHQTSSLSKET